MSKLQEERDLVFQKIMEAVHEETIVVDVPANEDDRNDLAEYHLHQ